MPKLFSYVVHHDLGYAPHPFGGLCTLARCKYGDGRKRNIVELAEVGDWVAGTGGADLRQSAGHGKLVYAMRVGEKIPLDEYCRKHGGERADAEVQGDEAGRVALVSDYFFYFGRNAIDVSEIPPEHLDHPFEKSGPSHRSDFSPQFIDRFAAWLRATFRAGVHGPPCKAYSGLRLPTCPATVKRRTRGGC